MKEEEKLKDSMKKQVPFRIHANDYKVLRKILTDDELTFQSFSQVCVDAYMTGDPLMLRLLKAHKEMAGVPKDVLERYSLSQRERQALLEQIDKEMEKKEVG